MYIMCDSDSDCNCCSVWRRDYDELRKENDDLEKDKNKLENKYNKLLEEKEDLLEKIELLEHQIEFFKTKRKQSNKHIKSILHSSNMYEKVWCSVVPYVEPDKIDDFLEDIKNGKYKTGKYNL